MHKAGGAGYTGSRRGEGRLSPSLSQKESLVDAMSELKSKDEQAHGLWVEI